MNCLLFAVTEPAGLEQFKFYLDILAALVTVVLGIMALRSALNSSLKKIRKPKSKSKSREKERETETGIQVPLLIRLAVILLLISPILIACMAVYYREAETGSNWIIVQFFVFITMGVVSRQPPSWIALAFLFWMGYGLILLSDYHRFESERELEYLSGRSVVAHMRYESVLDTGKMKMDFVRHVGKTEIALAELKLALANEKMERIQDSQAFEAYRLKQAESEQELLQNLKRSLRPTEPVQSVKEK